MQPGLRSFDEGTRLAALRGALEDPRFVLTGVGALLVSESNKAFREERLGAIAWKSRDETKMNPNWPGILADFAAGKAAPPARRFQGRPVLTDTGLMRRSVASRVVSHDTVEAGSMLPYAAVLHAGGESKTVPITKAVQDRLWKWIKSKIGGAKRAQKALVKVKGDNALQTNTRDRKAKEASVAGRLRWLLSPSLTGQRLTIKHPARPIVGLPKQLVKDIEGLYGTAIQKGA